MHLAASHVDAESERMSLAPCRAALASASGLAVVTVRTTLGGTLKLIADFGDEQLKIA